ncbi:MAG TPA: hypothetical protein VK796_07950, partial [Cytophaga sp.]|nr:hypothetical protein [Cytophaga sp.]
LSHTEITITMVIAQFLFVALTLLMRNADLHIILAVQFALYFSSVYVLKRFIPVRKKLHIVRDELPEATIDDLKVYPIYPSKEKVSVREDS